MTPEERLKLEWTMGAQKDLNTRLWILIGSKQKRSILKIIVLNSSMKILKTEFF
jgi:hypothetical protein